MGTGYSSMKNSVSGIGNAAELRIIKLFTVSGMLRNAPIPIGPPQLY